MRPIRVVLTAVLSLTLSGCYYLQAFSGQMEIVSKRRPIARVIADPETTPSLRTRLEYVAAARDFASRELGLPDNESYRGYADLGRPYVVWNVFAADEFSVKPRRWCFPVAGCVVYRGYFSEDGAKRYAARLARSGYDTAVGGVAAYSTLGHFDDPVLNTMLGWSDAQLAATLFHELAHQVVYVPGDSDFNEGFATIVEEVGLERWLRSRGALGELEAWEARRTRHSQFIALLLDARERLAALYDSKIARAEMQARKQYEFGVLKLQFEQLREQWGGYAGYDVWFKRTLNNAHLVSAATYHGCVPGLRSALRSLDGDLARFYEQMKALAGDAGAAHRAALCSIETPEGEPAT